MNTNWPPRRFFLHMLNMLNMLNGLQWLQQSWPRWSFVPLNWRGADTFVPGAYGAVDRTSYLACSHDMGWIHRQTGKDMKRWGTYWYQKKICKSKAKFSAKFGIPDQLELWERWVQTRFWNRESEKTMTLRWYYAPPVASLMPMPGPEQAVAILQEFLDWFVMRQETRSSR